MSGELPLHIGFGSATLLNASVGTKVDSSTPLVSNVQGAVDAQQERSSKCALFSLCCVEGGEAP